ncbi:MAG: porin [Arenicellales bacterium]
MNKHALSQGVGMVAALTMLLAPQAVMAEGSLTISGWINEGMTYWDDGDDSDAAQLSDNGTTLGSRIVFSGTYKPPKTDLNAGFEVILEPLSGTSNFAGGGQITPLLFANQDNLDTFNGGDIGALAHNLYVGGGWGKITLGLQSMPTDNIAVLQDPSLTIWSGISPVFRGNGFFIRGVEENNPATGSPVPNTWGSFLQCLTTPGLGIGIDCNGVYRNGARYDLPTFANVSMAIGYANDSVYDIALKYDPTFDNFNVKFGMGYAINNDGGTNVNANDSEVFQTQLGVLHNGTGLFGVATYQYEKADNADSGTGDDTDAYYFKAGIQKSWFGFGDSSIYADYGLYNDQYGAAADDLGNPTGVSGSEVEHIGVGVVQSIGSRLRIYGKWARLSLDVNGNANARAIYDNADDLNMVTVAGVFFF